MMPINGDRDLQHSPPTSNQARFALRFGDTHRSQYPLMPISWRAAGPNLPSSWLGLPPASCRDSRVFQPGPDAANHWEGKIGEVIEIFSSSYAAVFLLEG
jgi:hypothetical protein